ncbi:CBS domain-containing protein [Kibdelosporangium philippinense]|uniref:CBS domain-containing protein n=1 Tax=Kibdelosporangium philippinense TaxID=211113 RepID=A0ABS8Z9Y5_9PSEU|nr:CBS domain-containing protein [Kibdelosporangium philippinense]MCE7004673.1 CBS domain-containing protein [Kibdelosporangium philippinense]
MHNPTVASVMTKDPVTVTPETEFKEIVNLLASKQISAVAVLAKDGFPLGVVSEADLLHKQESDGTEPEHHLFTSKQTHVRQRKAVALQAKDLMSAPVFTISPEETLAVAARELARRGVRRLFVVDDHKLVGVVSRRDLLSVFRRSDQDIQQEIVQEILVRTLWADPKSMSVTVEDGVVTMLGRLERRCEVEIASRLVPKIPGVIEVRNRMSYAWNDMPERTRL